MPDVQDIDRVATGAVEDLKRIPDHRDDADVRTFCYPGSYLRRAADMLNHIKKASLDSVRHRWTCVG
jgi:hypothetical protein